MNEVFAKPAQKDGARYFVTWVRIEDVVFGKPRDRFIQAIEVELKGAFEDMRSNIIKDYEEQDAA